MNEQEKDHVMARQDEVKAAVLGKFAEGEKRMNALQEEITGLKESVGTLLEILEAAKGGFKFLGWLGVGAKWVGGVAGALTAIWLFVQTVKSGGKL